MLGLRFTSPSSVHDPRCRFELVRGPVMRVTAGFGGGAHTVSVVSVTFVNLLRVRPSPY